MNQDHIALHYFATAESSKVKLSVQEHNNIRWFSAKEIKHPKWEILPAVQFYALEALKAASRV